jgi:hypothetical protein
VCSQPHSLFDDVSNAKALNPQAEKAHTHAQAHIRITFPPERKEEKLSKIFVGRNGLYRLIKLDPIEGLCIATVACTSICLWYVLRYVCLISCLKNDFLICRIEARLVRIAQL